MGGGDRQHVGRIRAGSELRGIALTIVVEIVLPIGNAIGNQQAVVPRRIKGVGTERILNPGHVGHQVSRLVVVQQSIAIPLDPSAPPRPTNYGGKSHGCRRSRARKDCVKVSAKRCSSLCQVPAVSCQPRADPALAPCAIKSILFAAESATN